MNRVGWLMLLFPMMAGCSGVDVLNSLVPHCGYTLTADLAYGGLPRQKLDVYRPKKPLEGGPVVIFFYGGHWQYGSKSDYFFVAQALASRGFVAVLPDYRLYPEAAFPAFVQDGASAVRWVHENIGRFGGDPGKIYLMGHSAGAYIAAMLTLDGHYLKDVGLDQNAIRGTAALSGPYDFVPLPEDRAVFGMSETDAMSDPAIEPIHFVDGHAPPLLLLHGLKDQTVEAGNASRLEAKIRSAGGKVQYIAYPARAHVGVVLALAWPFRWLDPVLDDTVKFFNGH
jgi:acetyl esterase/lipase